jgi:hypothetical protein
MDFGLLSGRGANRLTRIEASGAHTLLAGVLLTGRAFPQARSAAGDVPQSTGQEALKEDQRKKPALAEATRVSTDEAARSVAKEKSKPDDAKAKDEKIPDSGVTEFRPVPPDSKGAAEDRSTSGGEKKSQGRAPRTSTERCMARPVPRGPTVAQEPPSAQARRAARPASMWKRNAAGKTLRVADA